MSPIESLYSLPIAPGAKAFSANRSSGETASTGDSFIGTSPPKVLPKDRPGEPTNKPDLVPSPLHLSSPVSSKMGKADPHPQPGAAHEGVQGSRRLPSPPGSDSQSPATPNSSSKALPTVPGDLMNTAPQSLTSQSPSQSQLWRRRSVKSDKALSVAELKLTSSHGSTAASSQQSGSLLPQQDSSLSRPLHPLSGSDLDSPVLKGPASNFGHMIRPSGPTGSLPRNPPAEFYGNPQPTHDDELDGFTRYAQEVEDCLADRACRTTTTTRTDATSPARSPEVRRPPTPEYDKDERRDYAVAAAAADNSSTVMSPASPALPITPPSDGRPLSMIPEDFVKDMTAAAAAGISRNSTGPPPSVPLPALPPRSSSRLSPSAAAAAAPAPATTSLGSPRRPVSAGRAAPVTASAAAAATAAGPASGSRPGSSLASSPVEVKSPSFAMMTTINNNGNDDNKNNTTTNNINNDNNTPNDFYAPIAIEKEEKPISSPAPAPAPAPTQPVEANHHFPTQQYSQVFLPGDVIPAPRLRETQLDCFAGHAVLTFSRNESHPVGCMACLALDRGPRFTCSHCSARVCARCRDALLANGSARARQR